MVDEMGQVVLGWSQVGKAVVKVISTEGKSNIEIEFQKFVRLTRLESIAKEDCCEHVLVRKRSGADCRLHDHRMNIIHAVELPCGLRGPLVPTKPRSNKKTQAN